MPDRSRVQDNAQLVTAALNLATRDKEQAGSWAS